MPHTVRRVESNFEREPLVRPSNTRLPSTHTGAGLVDLQLNGYAGFDFNSPPAGWNAREFLRIRGLMHRRGVVAALPTLITDEAERMIARARCYAWILDQAPELCETFPKLHIEGPFISPEDGPRGAHPQAHCRSPRELPDLLDRLRDASGDRLGMVTLAPELPGAMDLIDAATSEGICVALGHTQSSAEVLSEAVNAGARISTHLGNGSHQTLPRLANYIQAQLADDRLLASFIADGHHLPWYTLKNFVRAKTPERCVLVTDAIAAADAGPGRYRLGDGEVIVSSDLRVHRPGQANLAGSALTLDRAIVNTVLRCGVAFEQGWEMASRRPAALVGLDTVPEIMVKVSEEGFSRNPETNASP